MREENVSLHQDYSKVCDHRLCSDQQLKTLKLALSSCSSLSPATATARKHGRVEGTCKRVQGKLIGEGTDDDDVLSVLLSPVQ